MRYFRPTSLSWWAGVFLIFVGVAQAAGWPPAPVDGSEGLSGVLDALTVVLTSLTGLAGDGSPAYLIGTGMGIIGIRDAIKREADEAEFNAEDRHGEMMVDLHGAKLAGAYQADKDASFEDGDDFDDPSELLGESPLPPGVRDPYADGGSRG